MFKHNSQEPVIYPNKNLKQVGSGHLNKLRILQSISLKKLNDSQSNHSSVLATSIHNSIKSIGDASMTSSQFSLRSSLVKSQPKQKKLYSKSQSIEQLLQKHYSRVFTKSLVQFLNKDWNNQQAIFLAQRQLQKFVQLVMQRSSWMKDLVDQFLDKEYEAMNGEERRTMTSILFKQAIKALKDIEGIVPDIIKKIPDEKLFKQETILQELSKKLLQIYDPKFSYSNSKIKERMSLYLQQFAIKRNNLKSDICTKLKSNLQFLEEVQKYFSIYQKEILRLKSQLTAVDMEKNKMQELLNKKSCFTPIQVDYDRMYELKEKANEEIRHDLNVNIVQLHEEKHKKNQTLIIKLQDQNSKLREQIDQLRQQLGGLKDQVQDFKKNVPEVIEMGTQVFLISKSKASQAYGAGGSSSMSVFLQNVVTPFSFSLQITGSLINILSIDKVLFDYDIIRQRVSLRSFQQFIFQWFIIRTGCKKIAQIFIKNFLYSLKQLKSAHKRFSIFYRICGFSGYRKRNMQQDLEGIFFTTHLCWYYLLKLALMYRKKLSDNPTGFHLFPPINCEDIFKLPLRKIYELVEEFLRSEQIEVPADLSQKIDHYCINQISKFKSKSQSFQKETLQQIHILREINFDLVAGFVLEYVADLKCSVVEKLLRTVDNQQKQAGYILGYSQFQSVYRKFFRERRAKIQQIYFKLCLVNQHDMLDVQNVRMVVLLILEDETPLRGSFQKLQSLRMLVLSQKTAIMRNEKKVLNPNSYQNFRERYYHQFYDFYNTTAFLEEIFKIVKGLIRKRLKQISTSEVQIDKIVEQVLDKPNLQPKIIKKEQQKQDQNQSEYQQKQEDEKTVALQAKNKEGTQHKDPLLSRLDEWGRIMLRVPHFASKVLTIEQIVIHNMRRKQMIEVTQYAWRTLREILTILGNS